MCRRSGGEDGGATIRPQIDSARSLNECTIPWYVPYFCTTLMQWSERILDAQNLEGLWH